MTTERRQITDLDELIGKTIEWTFFSRLDDKMFIALTSNEFMFITTDDNFRIDDEPNFDELKEAGLATPETIARMERQRQEEVARRRQRDEANERYTYERLRAKFEGPKTSEEGSPP